MSNSLEIEILSNLHSCRGHQQHGQLILFLGVNYLMEMIAFAMVVVVVVQNGDQASLKHLLP